MNPSKADATVPTSMRAAIRLAVLALALALASPAGALPAAPLDLGRADLRESRFNRAIAPGAHYTRIARGRASQRERFTVDIGFAATRAEAEALRDRARAYGYRVGVRRIAKRAPDDPTPGPLGFLVRGESFATEADAAMLRGWLLADGFRSARVVYSGEDGRPTSGPWVVHVLEVDPALYAGRVDVELATEVVPGRELLTALARRTGAAAAINGGYFVIGDADGTPGDLAGISVIDGALVSEAVNGRTSLLLSGSGGGATPTARVAALSTRLSVRAGDGATREVDGLNRRPGLIRACGGSGGDVPTEAPKHDFTCTDAGELIRFTRAHGEQSDPGEGAEAVLDGAGRVLELRAARGGPIPADGSVLAGTGDGAEWLRTHAQPGGTLEQGTGLEADGVALPLDTGLDVVNGGPRLLAGGAARITAAAEGFHWPENPEFYYRFGARRNPRTLAGVTAEGKLLLVAVEGRRPGRSVGASFEESAAILRSLGASEGVNLDGGGSTGLTVGSELFTLPSDATGERPIGDALVLRPATP